MLKRLFVSIFIALMVGVAILGCGDDGSTDGSDASAAGSDSGELTKAEFIKKADALCLRSTEKALDEIVPEMERLEKRGAGAQKPIGELRGEAIVAVLLPSLEEQIDEIRDLAIPAGDEQQVDRILAVMQRSIEATRNDPPSANDDGKAGLELRNKFTSLDKVGRAYGFDGCAYGGPR